MAQPPVGGSDGPREMREGIRRMTITDKTSPSETSPRHANPTQGTGTAAAGTDFWADLRVGAAPARVLAALCEAEAISGWWGSTTGSPAEGLRFGVGFGSTRQIDMTVMAAGPSRVEWAVDAAPH